MSDPRNRSRGSLRHLIALAVLLALAGCGSSSDRSPEEARDVGSKAAERPAVGDPCEPHRFEGEAENPPRRGEQGRRVRVAIGNSELDLEVGGTEFPRSIPIRFGERDPFEAPQGSMLVAVDYRLDNEGQRELKPSEDFNARLLLRASGALYPYATALPCSIPLAASWAVAHGGDNPAVPVPPDESATSAVVFIVPKQPTGTALSLVLPGQVGIALSPAG